MSFLSDSIQTALPELRAQAECLMTLTLRAYEPSGATVDADGYEVPGFTDRGTCRGKVQSGGTTARDANTRYVRIGEVERPVLEGGLHIPTACFISGDELLVKPGWQRGVGWEFVIEGVNGLADCALLGRRFLVVEVPAKSFATARRLTVVSLN